MEEKKKKPVAQQAYDELAEAYAARVDTKPHNAYYERPATLSLLPQVKDKRVLDAGCGPGVYAEWLVQHGAEVIAFDGNPKMVTLAKKRLGRKVQVEQANLEEPLEFVQDASFDVLVCPLAMDYVKEWEPTLAEFYRVLKAGGCLVFSMEHPYTKFDIHRETSNYFELELVQYTWRGFGKPVNVPSFRRPLSEVIDPLIRVGFILDKILEPLPTLEFKETEPEDYEELTRSPGFMCIRAYKGQTITSKRMKSTLLLIFETLLILAGLALYALRYLQFPILPLILVAWASLRIRSLRWRDIGLWRPDRWLRTIGVALLVGVGYQALDILMIAPLLQMLTSEAVDLSQFNSIRGNLPLLVASLVISWTLAAFVEEMFFRGYLLNRIMDLAGRERLGVAIAVIGNALVFGAAHAYQGISGIIDTTLAGLVLGLLYFYARRNLWLPILAHGIIDTTGFLLIYAGLYNQ